MSSTSQEDINRREWADPNNWSRAGFYSSALDDRLWVPKRPGTGVGDAINLGQRGARTFLVSLLIVPTVVLAVMLAWVWRG